MRIVLVMIAMAAIAPAYATAQDSAWKVAVIPRVGFFHADKAAGLLAPGYESPNIRMQNSVTVGAAIEVSTPLAWLRGRALVERTLDANLIKVAVPGTRNQDQPFMQGTSVLNLAASVVAFPRPRRLPLYVAGGIGLKRYDFGRKVWSEDSRFRLGGRESALALNVGVGAQFDVGRLRLDFAATDFVSGFSGGGANQTQPAYSRSLVQRALHDRLGHDLFLTLGIVIRAM